MHGNPDAHIPGQFREHGLLPGRMTSKSRFVDVGAARVAVSIVERSIEHTLAHPGVSAKQVLHLVVMDPGASPATCSFEEGVLHEQSIGNTHDWDVDYAAFARQKARLSWCHEMDSRRLIQMFPHRLGRCDSTLWGGVWLDGIVVAASGALPAWDEAFSLWVAGGLRSIALERSTGMSIA